ncbi:MAG: hypothetical protein IPP74_11545 [Alphaproteobacteria bacterium]|nr:hypothetical protein [Alphaproteobacteria bacterium]
MKIGGYAHKIATLALALNATKKISVSVISMKQNCAGWIETINAAEADGSEERSMMIFPPADFHRRSAGELLTAKWEYINYEDGARASRFQNRKERSILPRRHWMKSQSWSG